MRYETLPSLALLLASAAACGTSPHDRDPIATQPVARAAELEPKPREPRESVELVEPDAGESPTVRADDAAARPHTAPFHAVVSSTACVVVADAGIEIAPDQVFRITRNEQPSFRARLQQLREVRVVERNGATRVGTIPDAARAERRFLVVAFPQDVEGDPPLAVGETIDVTPLAPIPGSPDLPRRSGASDVAPGAR